MHQQHKTESFEALKVPANVLLLSFILQPHLLALALRSQSCQDPWPCFHSRSQFIRVLQNLGPWYWPSFLEPSKPLTDLLRPWASEQGYPDKEVSLIPSAFWEYTRLSDISPLALLSCFNINSSRPLNFHQAILISSFITEKQEVWKS